MSQFYVSSSCVVIPQECCGMWGLPLSKLKFSFMEELGGGKQIMNHLNQNALCLLKCVSREQLTKVVI